MVHDLSVIVARCLVCLMVCEVFNQDVAVMEQLIWNVREDVSLMECLSVMICHSGCACHAISQEGAQGKKRKGVKREGRGCNGHAC